MLARVQVSFAVADLARSLDFYERAFGWPRNDRIACPSMGRTPTRSRTNGL